MNYKVFISRVLLSMLFIWACLSGCDMPMFTDMPHLEYEPEEPAQFLAGPYLAKMSPESAVIAFATDREVSAGLSIIGNETKQLIRSGERKKYHAIEVKGLLPGSTYSCEIRIKNTPAKPFFFTTYPDTYDEVRVAFVLDGEQDKKKLNSAMNIIQRKGIENIIFLGSQIKKSRNSSDWVYSVFKPYQNMLEGKAVYHFPEAFDLSRDIFPAYPTNESYAVNMGPIYIIMVAENDIREENLFRFEPWFLKELENAGQRWKVVIMPKNILSAGAKGINTAMLEKWAPYFEKYKVDFVFTVAPRFYHRSLAVGSPEKGVRYISLPSLSPEKVPQSGADFTSSYSGSPGFFVLNTTRLGRIEGRQINLRSRIEDGFVMEYREKDKESDFIDREKMVTRAWAEYSQKRELKTIIRQICKAVENPARPKKIKLIINNPSPLPFSGKLAWKAEDAVFYIMPESVHFNLQPGEGISSTFDLHQNKADGLMPLLQVKTDNGYTESGRMLLTWKQEFSIKRTKDPYLIDGNTDEDFWDKATAVTDFTAIDGGKLNHKPPIAWVIAGDDGLRIRYRCPMDLGNNAKSMVSERDGNVWLEDSVEVFLDPKVSGREWYQFSLSSNDVALDSNSLQGRAWNPKWKHYVKMKDDRYNVEILIPYETLGFMEVPEKGEKWGINLTRNYYYKGKCEVAQAAPTHGPNSRSGCYMLMTFE